VMAGKQPVKQRRSNSTDVKTTGRARGKACANSHRGDPCGPGNHEIMNHFVALSRTIAVMRWIALTATLLSVPATALFAGGQQSSAPHVTHEVFSMPDGGDMTYGISVPDDAPEAGSDRGRSNPVPLILALHPGGARTAYYGSSFMRSIVEPALREWNAIIIAPDAPTRSWATDVSEQAVLALIEEVATRYAVNRDRILVTGFSLGGRGTWFFATRHADLFTGAIPMAGFADDDSLDGLGSMPIHIVHSRDDEVVPYGPAAAAAGQLEARGHSVRLTELSGVGHFTMGAYIGPLRQAGAWMLQQWEGQ